MAPSSPEPAPRSFDCVSHSIVIDTVTKLSSLARRISPPGGFPSVPFRPRESLRERHRVSSAIHALSDLRGRHCPPHLCFSHLGERVKGPGRFLTGPLRVPRKRFPGAGPLACPRYPVCPRARPGCSRSDPRPSPTPCAGCRRSEAVRAPKRPCRKQPRSACA